MFAFGFRFVQIFLQRGGQTVEQPALAVGTYINSNGFTVGRYRLTFKIRDLNRVPETVPLGERTIDGKTIDIESWTIKPDSLEAYLVFNLKTNPAPIAAILVGVLIVGGLALTYMSLVRVEKIVDNPISIFLFIAIIVALIYIFWRGITANRSR